jgi:monofunctional biosynthetic peptidoglycan transglycosylase
MEIPIPETTTPPSPPVRPSRARRLWTVAAAVFLALLAWPAEAVLALRFVDPPCSVMMLYKSAGELLRGRSPAWRHENRSRRQVSRCLYQAIIAAEDQRFFDHRGFDLVEIEKAREKHERRPKRPLRGASTLTQQVAKNLFLPPWRSFVRKGLEAYFTLWIELLWPKSRILEVYTNIVEFAPGVYGAQAAARHHFHKDAGRLTPREAALLAAVLPNPGRWSASRPTPYIRRRAQWILSQMAPLPKE